MDDGAPPVDKRAASRWTRGCLRMFALVLLGALLGTAGTPAFASCAQDSGPDGSPVIFAGTAAEERRGFTRFAVDEVWAGPDLAPEVWVLSGQEQPAWPWSLVQGVSSSVDAEFVLGEVYLVGASRAFHTSACSVAEMAADDPAYRPDTVRSPVSDGLTGADPPIGPWGIGLVLTGIVALVAVLVLGMRRRSTGT